MWTRFVSTLAPTSSLRFGYRACLRGRFFSSDASSAGELFVRLRDAPQFALVSDISRYFASGGIHVDDKSDAVMQLFHPDSNIHSGHWAIRVALPSSDEESTSAVRQRLQDLHRKYIGVRAVAVEEISADDFQELISRQRGPSQFDAVRGRGLLVSNLPDGVTVQRVSDIFFSDDVTSVDLVPLGKYMGAVVGFETPDAMYDYSRSKYRSRMDGRVLNLTLIQ